jgi:hypothetical protein
LPRLAELFLFTQCVEYLVEALHGARLGIVRLGRGERET